MSRPESPPERNVEQVSRLQSHSFLASWYELVSDRHFWYQWRLRAFLGQVRSLGVPTGAPLRVLDVGGGTGVLRAQIEASTAWVVDCADLDREALAEVAPGRGRVLYYDILDRVSEYRERYDAVVLFDVLEHLDETERFIDAVKAHLKPGGILFVNVPAMRFLTSRYDEVVGHLRRYQTGSLREELERAELDVLDSRYWGLLNVPLLLARRLLLRLAPARDSDDVVRKGFRPPGAVVNALLVGLMRLETALVSRPPMGTSLLAAGRKAGGDGSRAEPA